MKINGAKTDNKMTQAKHFTSETVMEDTMDAKQPEYQQAASESTTRGIHVLCSEVSWILSFLLMQMWFSLFSNNKPAKRTDSSSD